MQDEDEIVRELRELAMYNKKPTSKEIKRRHDELRDKLEIKRGILYHKWTVKNGVNQGDEVRQLVVPRKAKEEILREFHDEKHAGHMGMNTTFARVREMYWWPRMNADVKRWVKTCDKCQRMTNPTQKVGLLQPTTSETLQGRRRWAIDILGPYPTTRSGEEYIMVMIDVNDGWPEAFAMKRHTTQEVIDIWRNELVPRHGVPDEILTDRGTEFLSNEAMSFYETYGIKKKSTTAFHPQTDGAAEALVKKIKNVLKKTCERWSSWKEDLPEALMALRSAPRAVTGTSAFELRHGYKMTLPMYLKSPVVREDVVDREMWKRKREKFRFILDEQAEKMKKYYDQGRVRVNYKPRDLVLLREMTAGPRDEQWSGPFEVAKMQSEGVVLVRDFKDNLLGSRHPVVAIAQTKPYYSRERIGEQSEDGVEAITGHKKKKQQYAFRIKWSNGETTWEPESNLVDYNAEDEEPAVVNEALLRYVANIPSLRARFQKRWKLSEDGWTS